MGKKGSWFAAIKRVFIPNSKEKLVNSDGSDRKSTKEKKKEREILGHGETKSFIPLFREPSSIEKILGEADQQNFVISPPTGLPAAAEQPNTPPLVLLPRAASPRVTSPRAASPRDTSPRAASPWVASPGAVSSRVLHHRKEVSYNAEPTPIYHHLSAIKIQAAYRGYMARRSFRALNGLVRLQGVVRGQNVKRQTMNAMKIMQLLVRVQTQIQSRRIQMLENQALHRHQAYKNDKELLESGLEEEWDDSLLTKEEIEARLHRKEEAIMKRERAMAYAYSHKLWKGNPKSAETWAMDIRSGGFPWWWNRLERQLPPANPSYSQTKKSFLVVTPPRPTLEPKPSTQPPAIGNDKKHNPGMDNLEVEALTPRSTRSAAAAAVAVTVRTKDLHTPSSNNRTPTNSSIPRKYLKPRTSAAAAADSGFDFDVPLKDDDSLRSCPPFSVPNYMTPTVSAKAKVRTSSSNPKAKDKYRFPGGTPPNTDSKSKRRFLFPLTPNIGSFKWNKGSTKEDSTSQKHQSLQSIGDLSIDSTVSMPAEVGRKSFNRFV